MLIIWGSKARQEQRGIVADRCETCRGLSLYAVIDVYKVSHLYYIPLGRGTVVASALKCLGCGSERAFHAHMYATVVPTHAVLSLQEVLRQSNPRLNEAMRVVPETPIPDGDERAQASLRRLNDVAELDAASNMLRLRLLTWNTLDEAGRDALLADVETYVRDRKHEGRAVKLLGLMREQKPSAAGLAAYWALVLGLPLVLVVLLRPPSELAIFVWGASILGCYWLAGRLARDMDRRWYEQWFLETVIPSAEKSEVSLPLLVAMMRDGQAAADAAGLSYADLLERVARDNGRWRDAAPMPSRSAVMVPVPPRPRFPGLGRVFGMSLLVLFMVPVVSLLTFGLWTTRNESRPAYEAPPPRPAARVAAQPTRPATTAGAPGWRESGATAADPRPATGGVSGAANHTAASVRAPAASPSAPRVTVAGAPSRAAATPRVTVAGAPPRAAAAPRVAVAGAPPRAAVPSSAGTVDVPPPPPARDEYQTASGKRIPPEFLPRPGAAPGIENAWVSGGFDEIPHDLKTVFHPRDEIFISLLYVSLRPAQHIVIKLHHDASGGEPGMADHDSAIGPKSGTGFTAISLSNRVKGFDVGHYTIIFELDGRDVRHLTFEVVPG